MALRRNVLREDDILSEMYADTRSDVSDYSDNESLDSDSDVPTTAIFYWSTDPTISTPIFPHVYQDNFHNSVRCSDTARQKRESLRHCKD